LLALLREADVEWFEDETFWVDFVGHLTTAQRRAEAVRRVASSPLFHLRPGIKVLDLGCGPGTYAVPLAQRGAVVTAVDLSPAMLDMAAAAARDAGVTLRLVQADMRELVSESEFDLAISMYTSFGYFTDNAQNVDVLRNVHASLAPGGQLLLDQMGKEVMARLGAAPAVVDVDGGTLHLRGTILDDWARFRNDLTLVLGDRVRRGRIVHHLYSAVELKAMLANSGFTASECFGDYDGSPYGIDAQRLIVRAAA
jgi:SAM-dependent methyltransferase